MQVRTRLVAVASCAVVALALLVVVRVDHNRSRQRLVFDDEFGGGVGSFVNDRRWGHQTGGDGWGNHELETYTNSAENASLDGHGHLAITARREAVTGPDGIARDYTSARLMTARSWTYGRFEARIKLPSGQGLWPAFWLVGANLGTTSAPVLGELDVLESIDGMSTFFGSAHGDRTSGGRWSQSVTARPAGGMGGNWHVYRMDWSAAQVAWYVDGQRVGSLERSRLDAAWNWRFDYPQRMILNLAVGGRWPGAPDATTPFPATMLVDWVRVYQ